jgi:hypothetical protein
VQQVCFVLHDEHFFLMAFLHVFFLNIFLEVAFWALQNSISGASVQIPETAPASPSYFVMPPGYSISAIQTLCSLGLAGNMTPGSWSDF